jgi:GrpB-like predicted nucleotidyltransferase (UPF0157 family)
MRAMTCRYLFAEYSPEWPARFQKEAGRMRRLLGDTMVDAHHIGSTSVPGLAAKPVIDLMPVVREIALVDERDSEMVAEGYRSWGEHGIAGRRFYTRDRGGVRTHNVHVFAAGSPEIERHLALAAYLRAHPEVRREYEALKRAVYAEHPDEIAAYCAGKDAWIKRMEPVAVEWFRQQGA